MIHLAKSLTTKGEWLSLLCNALLNRIKSRAALPPSSKRPLRIRVKEFYNFSYIRLENLTTSLDYGNGT